MDSNPGPDPEPLQVLSFGFRAEQQVWSLQILTLYNFYTLSGLLLVEETPSTYHTLTPFQSRYIDDTATSSRQALVSKQNVYSTSLPPPVLKTQTLLTMEPFTS